MSEADLKRALALEIEDAELIESDVNESDSGDETDGTEDDSPKKKKKPSPKSPARRGAAKAGPGGVAKVNKKVLELKAWLKSDLILVSLCRVATSCAC